MKKRPTNHDGTKVERRKAHRFSVSIPLEVSWCGADGKPLKEAAVARQVNCNGGHLEMAAYPEMGTRISVMNLLSAETAEARVLATPNSREGVSQGIIIELVSPNEGFWGVNLQVKNTDVELRKLEKALVVEGIDLRLLKEFRDAADYLQLIAQVVQQLREAQLRAAEPDEAHSLLMAKRLERATSFCLGVLSDMEDQDADFDSEPGRQFQRCVEELHARLRDSSDCAPRHGLSRGIQRGT